MKIGSALSAQLFAGQTDQSGQYAQLRPVIPLETGAIESFSDEMTRRASQATAPEKERTTDEKGLNQAMTNAVSYVRDSLGDNAARAVMGIVMSQTGNGQLTEDSLGEGFVSALQFIDNTFGTKVGDQAIGVFNGELNNAINGYFQNGHNESFLAVDLDTAMSQAGQAAGAVVSQFMKKVQENTADLNATLQEQMEKDARERRAEEEAVASGEAAAELSPGEQAMAQAQDQAGAQGGAATGAETAQTGSQGQEKPSSEASQAPAEHPAVQAAARSKVRSKRLMRRSAKTARGYGGAGIKAGVVVDAKV